MDKKKHNIEGARICKHHLSKKQKTISYFRPGLAACWHTTMSFSRPISSNCDLKLALRPQTWWVRFENTSRLGRTRDAVLRTSYATQDGAITLRAPQHGRPKNVARNAFENKFVTQSTYPAALCKAWRADLLTSTTQLPEKTNNFQFSPISCLQVVVRVVVGCKNKKYFSV